MSQLKPQPERRQLLTAAQVLALIVGLVTLGYLALSLNVSSDPLLMPLDDTYIHFQYAREWAQGHPLVYNPGDPATSGGTSLIYPPLLALGYALGFHAWTMAYWALALGVLSLAGASWLVYLIARRSPFDEPTRTRHGYALALAVAFALSGPNVWAALSGMETALFVFLVLLVGYAVQYRRERLTLFAAILVTLARPEGLIVAAGAVAALALRDRWPEGWLARGRRAVGLALPILAGGVQPLINWWATDSFTSSGLQAKSYLYNTSVPMSERLLDALKFFGRMWGEFLSGRSPDFGILTSPLLAEAALAALILGCVQAWRTRRVTMGLVILIWVMALTAAISTLDTAFWQFKRYQLPVMALFYPAAAWAAAALGDLFTRRLERRWAAWGLPALILIPAVFTTFTFARNYADNVKIVRDQQVKMAGWVKENLPADARVGAHDVGLVRYFGDRALYDVVGLTTPGAALSWRQGPGAVYEHMAASADRPNYFAIYPDVQGLRYLVNAGVIGTVLAEFPVDLPAHNVASATDYQAVYAADWSTTHREESVAQTSTLAYIQGLTLVDQIDVADMDNEADHAYTWWEDGKPPGYITEVYRHEVHACGLDPSECVMTDGGRVLTGGETFTLHTHPGEDLLLVTRVHGRTSVPLTLVINGQQVDQRVQPQVPGRWLEVVYLVEGSVITGTSTHVRIEAQIADPKSDAYSPYYHWAYQGTFAAATTLEATPVATFGEAGQVRLMSEEMHVEGGNLLVDLSWEGPAPNTGDGIVFVHVYRPDEINIGPAAQTVARSAGGVLPPANWLPGPIHDQYAVPLSGLEPGTYIVAIGLFDARTMARYPVSGADTTPDQRLLIGEITLEESVP